MKQYKISAQRRELRGSASCGRMRQQGLLPGVLYGSDKDNVPLSLPDNEISLLLKQEAFYSNILTLEVDGVEEKVVLKALQRHPSRPRLIHIDFMRVDESKPITMNIPLHFINEDKCVGVKSQGGISSHIMNEIEVECLPKDLPEYIEIDMGEMNVGDTIHVGDIKLPQGVEITSLKHGGDAAQPVVSVYVPKVVQETEETPAAEEGEAQEEQAAAAKDKDQDSAAE